MVAKSNLNKYRKSCLKKFKSDRWESKNLYFTTTGYTAFSHDGINWSRKVNDNENIWITTGKNSYPVLKKGSGEKDTYCGITTFLDKN